MAQLRGQQESLVRPDRPGQHLDEDLVLCAGRAAAGLGAMGVGGGLVAASPSPWRLVPAQATARAGTIDLP